MRIEIEPGVRLYVDVEGTQFVPDGPALREKPTLVLLHGGPGFDHSAFRPFFGRVADIAQVIYVDHRGHGRSDRRPPEEWTLDTFADDVVRLCDALGIVRPIVLGQSFGGFVAQRYIERHPAHPSKVILSQHLAAHEPGAQGGDVRQAGRRAARAACRRFWSDPNAATWADYGVHCRHLYNTTPQDPDAGAAHDPRARHPVPLGLRRAAHDGPAARPREGAVPGAGDGGQRGSRVPASPTRATSPPHCRRSGCSTASSRTSGHGAWRDDADAAFDVLRKFILA